MWTCPVCGRQQEQTVCTQCGFDESCNYERYPTLTPVGRAEPISVKRARWAREHAEMLRCPACGGTSFAYLADSRCFRCNDCGQRITAKRGAAKAPGTGGWTRWVLGGLLLVVVLCVIQLCVVWAVFFRASSGEEPAAATVQAEETETEAEASDAATAEDANTVWVLDSSVEYQAYVVYQSYNDLLEVSDWVQCGYENMDWTFSSDGIQVDYNAGGGQIGFNSAGDVPTGDYDTLLTHVFKAENAFYDSDGRVRNFYFYNYYHNFDSGDWNESEADVVVEYTESDSGTTATFTITNTYTTADGTDTDESTGEISLDAAYNLVRQFPYLPWTDTLDNMYFNDMYYFNDFNVFGVDLDWEYTYDSDGNLVEMVLSNEEDSFDEIYVVTGDAYGNCLSIYEYYTDFTGDGGQGLIISYTSRVFAEYVLEDGVYTPTGRTSGTLAPALPDLSQDVTKN